MSQATPGVSSNPELEMELPDDGRETPTGSSTGSTSPDPIDTTPGVIVRGGDDDGQ
jgi:hypothetical protein